jgi:PTH1 family peptidyl-tRNA hydrolase
MNESGRAVAAVSEFYKIPPKDMWVVHDDIDLPLGKIRIRAGGGSGGHNGVESLIAHLKTDAFLRFRLGVGRGAHRSVVEFVLSRFQQGEAGEMRKLIKHGVDAVRLALEKGTDRAMNRFN